MDIAAIVQHLAYVWPFLAWTIISAVLSEILERIFAKRMGEPVWLMYPRRLQGILPIIIGGVLGYAAFPDPIPYKIGAAGSGLLFAAGGALGVLIFDPLRDWLKAKYGVSFHLPGEDDQDGNK
jgi:TctA family transporter